MKRHWYFTILVIVLTFAMVGIALHRSQKSIQGEALQKSDISSVRGIPDTSHRNPNAGISSAEDGRTAPVNSDSSPFGTVSVMCPDTNTAPLDGPVLLNQLLAGDNVSITDSETTQLIVVEANGSGASIYAFSKSATGVWVLEKGPLAGHVGKNGVSASKVEGDLKTPTGLFSLPFTFGIKENPECAMEYRQVTADSYWVDDSESIYYNQWVEGTEYQDWKSAEHLADYPAQYAYAAVVNYNPDAVPDAGSAIFLHCGERPTAGCISVPQEAMAWFLKWLKSESNPQILIF